MSQVRAQVMLTVLAAACGGEPKREDTLGWAYDVAMNRAYEQARFGDFSQVLAMADAAIGIDSQKFEAYYYAALAHYKLGNQEPARRALDRATALAPQHRKRELDPLAQSLRPPPKRPVRKKPLAPSQATATRTTPAIVAPRNRSGDEAVRDALDGRYTGYFDGDYNAELTINYPTATLRYTSDRGVRWRENLGVRISGNSIHLDGTSYARLAGPTDGGFNLDHFTLRLSPYTLRGTYSTDEDATEKSVTFRRGS